MTAGRSEELSAIDRDFRQTYHSILLPQLKRMEFIRIILFFLFCLCAFGICAYVGILLWACLSSDKTDFTHYLYIAVIFCSIFVAYRFFEFVLNLILKKKMLNTILAPFKTFKSGRIFDIPSSQLRESKIVEKHVFKINPERIEGEYKGVEIKFNTAMLFDIERRYSAGKSSVKISNVFSGYIVEMDMNKQFSGHTILESCLYHTDESFFDFLKDDYYEMQEVELEDPDFKKHFSRIKSTDQTEARYLLTPSVMERLKELDMSLGRLLMLSDLRLSFLDKKILLVMKVRNVNNLLRLCVLNKPLYKQDKEICGFKDSLLEILEIVDELKLDKKLGL